MFVILNECEESRIVCGTVPARDPSAATLCQDDKKRLGKLLYYTKINAFFCSEHLALRPRALRDQRDKRPTTTSYPRA